MKLRVLIAIAAIPAMATVRLCANTDTDASPGAKRNNYSGAGRHDDYNNDANNHKRAAMVSAPGERVAREQADRFKGQKQRRRNDWRHQRDPADE